MDDITATLAMVEQQNREQDRRLKKLESNHEAICQLTYVTKDLVEAVKELTKAYEGHEQRIISLERAPGDKLIKVKDLIVAGFASALGGGILTWIITNTV